MLFRQLLRRVQTDFCFHVEHRWSPHTAGIWPKLPSAARKSLAPPTTLSQAETGRAVVPSSACFPGAFPRQQSRHLDHLSCSARRASRPRAPRPHPPGLPSSPKPVERFEHAFSTWADSVLTGLLVRNAPLRLGMRRRRGERVAPQILAGSETQSVCRKRVPGQLRLQTPLHHTHCTSSRSPALRDGGCGRRMGACRAAG